jgi:hypothetical protein
VLNNFLRDLHDPYNQAVLGIALFALGTVIVVSLGTSFLYLRWRLDRHRRKAKERRLLKRKNIAQLRAEMDDKSLP